MLGRLLRSDCSDGSVQQYTYNNVDNTTGKRYTYNGQTKSFGYTYQKGGIGETTTYPNGASRKQFLGHLAQVCKSTLTLPGGNTSTVEYGLYSPAEGFSSSAIGSVRYGQLNRSFEYSYTPQGNISAVCDGDRQSTYQYDEINQLIRENNAYLNKTVTYSYDAGGNILSKTTYPCTTGSLEGQTGETVTYSYGDSEWKDLLTAYNGQEITYDAIGNPLNYKNGWSFTWRDGRRLATAAANGKALSFAYNESGIRTQKTVDGELPDKIGSSALNDWIFNEDTIKEVLNVLMTNRIKIDYGQKIGKTIIFAKNHRHAEKMFEVFNKEYLHLNGFARCHFQP